MKLRVESSGAAHIGSSGCNTHWLIGEEGKSGKRADSSLETRHVKSCDLRIAYSHGMMSYVWIARGTGVDECLRVSDEEISAGGLLTCQDRI